MPVCRACRRNAAWGDYDNDGDIDILLSGSSDQLGSITRVYRNDLVPPNSVPSAPSGLNAAFNGGDVILGWSPSTDAQTPAPGLTYNLRVSTTPGGVDVASPLANTATGYRRVVQIGNANNGTTAILKSLPGDTYYWSVQAVDTAFAGSPFAVESTFVRSCTGSINPTGVNAPAAGGSGSVNVTAACSWTAISNAAWITVTSGSGGTGNGNVAYSVAANPGLARTGTITVASQTFTVSQAAPAVLPVLSIDDVTVTEGHSGTVNASFAVTLAPAATGTITVDYATADGTATAPADYTAGIGTLTFPAGSTSQTVTIPVTGDTAIEGDEAFFVNLSNSPVVIGDAQGIGTILDDDTPPLSDRELVHGADELQDLAAVAGAADVDYYRVAQQPRASYEAVVEGASGDLLPLSLDLLGADNATVLASSQTIGTGAARSLRWRNRSPYR